MSTYSAPTLLPTAFHMRTARLCLTNDWVAENGWTKAKVYTDPLAEYWTLRNSVGVTDLSGLYHYRISGEDAVALLDYVITDSVRAMDDGTARYSLWCDGSGSIVGDGMIYRLNAENFWVFTRQISYLWLSDAAIGFSATVEDVSRNFAGLAVQGPDARQLLLALGLSEIDTLKPLHVIETEIQKVTVVVGRVSSIGELGYELFVDANDALFLWDELLHHRTVMAAPVGASAFSLATVEAGHPRIGIDFISVDDAVRRRRAVTPYELGFDRFVEFEKPNFVGRQALEKCRGQVPKQILCGITYDGPVALSKCPIVSNNLDVGATTSVIWSPKLGRHIGFAWILNSALLSEEKLEISGRVVDELKVDRLRVPITIVPREFFRSSAYLETPVAVA